MGYYPVEKQLRDAGLQITVIGNVVIRNEP
jgi:hypothetical protein